MSEKSPINKCPEYVHTHCEQVVFAFEPVQENEFEQHRNYGAPFYTDSGNGGSSGGNVSGVFAFILFF